MRSGQFFLLVLVILCSHPVQRNLCAQPIASETAPARDATPGTDRSEVSVSDGDIEEVKPQLLYVVDPKTGKLVLALAGWTLEELRRMIDRQQPRVRPDESPFTVNKITISGTATAKDDAKGAKARARLQCAFTLHVWEDDVTVPLKLSGWVLRDFEHPAESDYSLARDEKSGGYNCRIRAAKGSRHVLEFSLVKDLSVIGGERQLRLDVPEAAESQLTFAAPLRAEGKVIGGLLDKVTHSGGNSPSTTFVVRGLKRGFQLAWSDAGKPSAKVQQVIDVDGEIVASIDELIVRQVARLKVRSVSGATFDRFRVRLPKGATLDELDVELMDYRIVPVANDGDLYEVLLQDATKGPIEVLIPTTQTRKVGQPVDLGGFEVLPVKGMSVSRQGGVVVVHVVGDWNVSWSNANENVRRVDPPEQPEQPEQPDPVAAFAYATQPFSLGASVRAKQKVIRVEPHYVFDVGRDEIRLQAVLKYRVSGAKAFDVAIDMPGWEIDVQQFGPEDLVNRGAIVIDSEGRVVVGLASGTTGAFELTLGARRKIDPTQGPIRIDLPKPVVDSLDPAVVAVIAADNVNLSLNGIGEDRLVPLKLPAPLPAPLALPQRQQPATFYRFGPAAAGFEAQLLVHAQQIDADVLTDVTLDKNGQGHVTQKLVYRVQHESVSSVTLDVPRALLASDQLEFSLDGEILLIDANSVREGDPSSPVSTLAIELPAARIGRFEVICRFPLSDLPRVTAEATTLVVPLVMPSDLQPQRNELRLVADPDIQVTDSVLPWTMPAEPIPAGDPQGARVLTSQFATAEATLTVRRVALATLGTTTVQRAWLQTWVTGPTRRDRAVFRFTSRGGCVLLTLPEGVVRDDVRAKLGVLRGDELTPLEGTRVLRTPAGKYSLELLPVTSSQRRYVLELYYRFADRGPTNGNGPGELSVQVPEFAGQTWVRRLYWQLILPENEHVVLDPHDLTGEFKWGWRRFFWGRQPLRNQGELEHWSDASKQDWPPIATSQYLFSAVGPRQQLVVQTISRSWIVGIASLVVLVAGLLLIYLPAVRRSGVLLLVAVVLVAMSWWAPATTVLFVQAASVGLFLALTALWLVRSSTRATSTDAVALGGASSIIEIGTTELRQTPVSSSIDLARASTATAATASQPPVSGSDG